MALPCRGGTITGPPVRGLPAGKPAACSTKEGTMRFVYFTKTLHKLSLKELVSFCKEVGLDGVDLTVRPGHPVTPDNALTALPEAARLFKDAGLVVGLVTA